jgi:hypothetical protein
VKVDVETHDAQLQLQLSIRGDGIEGADSRKGSGLIGPTDRVEVLGGGVSSPAQFSPNCPVSPDSAGVEEKAVDSLFQLGSRRGRPAAR